VEHEPSLTPPDGIVRRLVRKVGAIGNAQEQVYLSSRKPSHRWASESFPDLAAEFEYKAIWVAKQLREQFGSPDHWAYVEVVASHLVGVRAAAWTLGGAVGYVSLRRSLVRGRVRSYQVVLGAMRPIPPSASGGQGVPAHDAVWLPTAALIH
jgi:hypothetical protein